MNEYQLGCLEAGNESKVIHSRACERITTLVQTRVLEHNRNTSEQCMIAHSDLDYTCMHKRDSIKIEDLTPEFKSYMLLN